MNKGERRTSDRGRGQGAVWPDINVSEVSSVIKGKV